MRTLKQVVVLMAVAVMGAGCGGSDGNCARSFCGCSASATLVLDAVVGDSTGQPASGITVTCMGESAPVATTGSDGRFHVELVTQKSPGCSFERCRNVVFTDPTGTLPTTTLTHVQVNSGEVRMSLPDGGP